MNAISHSERPRTGIGCRLGLCQRLSDPMGEFISVSELFGNLGKFLEESGERFGKTNLGVGELG